MKLKVGDRVRIIPKTRFYNRSAHNPGGVFGVVIKVKDYGFPYKVLWDNGESNTYEIEDLEYFKLKKEDLLG